MKVLFHGKRSAKDHMEFDRNLLETGYEEPLLRFYEWDAFTATAGLFVDYTTLIDIEKLPSFHVAKRPTGGGLLFHEHDIAFSLFLPEGDPSIACDLRENFFWITKRLFLALQLPFEESSFPLPALHHFCMAEKTAFDPIYRGKKIGGGAERRTKKGLLHQGSLFLATPDWKKIELLSKDPKMVMMMKESILPLQDIVTLSRDEIKERIQEAFL